MTDIGLPVTTRIHRKWRALFKKDLPLLVLTIPGVAYFFIFHYLPMFGIVMAFKDYNFARGILGSEWIGFTNFEYFFTSNDAWRITRNTVGYSLAFIMLGNLTALLVALLLHELSNKFALKFYQSVMIFPNFLSWVLVGYLTYVFLNPLYGSLNQVLALAGLEQTNWYSNPAYWPYILIITHLWKSVGLQILIYYAALAGIDPQLYEAAQMDGAGRMRQAFYISIPGVIPVLTILVLLAVGDTFRGDFGLFYQIPRNIGVLYPVTDIIDTYVFRGLRNGDLAITAAVGLFQSVVGLILLVAVNWIVRRKRPENALF